MCFVERIKNGSNLDFSLPHYSRLSNPVQSFGEIGSTSYFLVRNDHKNSVRKDKLKLIWANDISSRCLHSQVFKHLRLLQTMSKFHIVKFGQIFSPKWGWPLPCLLLVHLYGWTHFFLLLDSPPLDQPMTNKYTYFYLWGPKRRVNLMQMVFIFSDDGSNVYWCDEGGGSWHRWLPAWEGLREGIPHIFSEIYLLHYFASFEVTLFLRILHISH